MRASELIGSQVVDERDRPVGLVRDMRVEVEGADMPSAFPIIGLVVGPPGLRSAAAHAWGYAEGRAAGPAVFRRLLEPALQHSLFVPADHVLDWGPGAVRIRENGRDRSSDAGGLR
ncbi:MAG TPA: PRC-barrel domain-containing protein [Solirubrobacterales bacterium]